MLTGLLDDRETSVLTDELCDFGQIAHLSEPLLLCQRDHNTCFTSRYVVRREGINDRVPGPVIQK